MYNFVFYYFYSIYRKGKDGGERGTAVTFAFVTQAIHVFLIYGIIKLIYAQVTGGGRMPDNGIFKILLPDRFWGMFTIALPWIIILYRYYNPRRILKIEERYAGIKMMTAPNAFKIILLIVVPVLIGIKVSNFTAHQMKQNAFQSGSTMK